VLVILYRELEKLEKADSGLFTAINLIKDQFKGLRQMILEQR
jgi:hypothetical protein